MTVPSDTPTANPSHPVDGAPAAGRLPGIRAIDHVGVAVPDLDDAIRLYTEVFGGTVTHREHNAEQQIEEAMISFGDSGARLQLIAPAAPTSTIAKFLDRNGPGLQQLAYRVDDVVAAGAALQGAGLRLLYERPRRGTAGSLINFVHPGDAGGVLVELVQPAPST
jgi:methylmalonyl-CoA/ethylmalonyl-CoA epimerase